MPGTPISVPVGMGCSAPRLQMEAVPTAGCTIRSAEADGRGQLDPLRPPGQHRLRAEVGGDARDQAAAQLAAGPVGAVEHDDLQARVGLDQVPGSGQPADAAADDAHALSCHACSLSVA